MNKEIFTRIAEIMSSLFDNIPRYIDSQFLHMLIDKSYSCFHFQDMGYD